MTATNPPDRSKTNTTTDKTAARCPVDHRALHAPADSADPCPFLRALHADGHIDESESLRSLGIKIAAAMDSGVDKKPATGTIVGIGLVGSAQSVGRLFATIRNGFRVDALRRGPLDKIGGGSRILNQAGKIDEVEIDRMATFGSTYPDEEGRLERGLNAAEVETFMDANFARPTARRRKIDRSLMNGEWPRGSRRAVSCPGADHVGQ